MSMTTTMMMMMSRQNFEAVVNIMVCVESGAVCVTDIDLVGATDGLIWLLMMKWMVMMEQS
jgi:hypothetical protein